MTHMKTLVTGANGHLGSNIVRQLLAEGREVKAFVRPNSDLRSLEGLDVEIVKGDVLKGDTLFAAMEGCDILYHTATVYSFWHKNPQVILDTAMVGTKNVLSAAQLYGKLKKIIYTSSIAAIGFSSKPEEVRSELDFNTERISVYNEAKTASEKVASALGIRLDLPLVIVNPATVLGEHDYKPTPSGQLILQYLKKGAPVFWEGGMNLVDVEDVARGHILAEKKGSIGDRYILGGDNVTIKQIYQTLSELTGGAPSKFRLTRLGAICVGTVMETLAKFTQKAPLFTKELGEKLVGKYAYYDISKAKRDLGFQTKSHRVVLAKGLKWFLESDLVSDKIKKSVQPHYLKELQEKQEEERYAEASS